MDELERKLAVLKSGASDARRQLAKAQAEQEAARTRVAEAVKVLKEDYGVGSVDEAKELLESLSETLAATLMEAESLLEALSV